jgi:hypothetical protein
MLKKLIANVELSRSLQYVNIALAKGGAMASLRSLDARDPATWEFSGFSQNGEDGILDFLTRRMEKPNNFFLEIGASFGTENNASWLAIARRFSGVFVEGDPVCYRRLSNLYSRGLASGVRCHKMIVTPENAPTLLPLCPSLNPDVFSIDIDGNDFYVVRALFDAGFRPSVAVVEYNSVFGPDRAMTVPYDSSVGFLGQDEMRLYYGVSITGWRRFFDAVGYRFVCIETNGVNAVFANPAAFGKGFLQRVHGTPFRENRQQLLKWGKPWQVQFESIKGREFVAIP